MLLFYRTRTNSVHALVIIVVIIVALSSSPV